MEPLEPPELAEGTEVRVDDDRKEINVRVPLDGFLRFLEGQKLGDVAGDLSEEVRKREFSPDRWKDLMQAYGQIVQLDRDIREYQLRSARLVGDPAYDFQKGQFSFTMQY